MVNFKLKIKKVVKYLFTVIVVLFIGKIIFREIFDNRPLKFEKYKTSAQFETAARFRFPIGSDLDQVINSLRKAGSSCYSISYYEPYRKDCKFLAYCDYVSSLFSLHPLYVYSFEMYADKDRKLIELLAWKQPSALFGT